MQIPKTISFLILNKQLLLKSSFNRFKPSNTISSEDRFQFRPIQPLGSAELYSGEEIARVQDVLTYQTSSEHCYRATLNIFDKKIKQLTQNTLKQIYGWVQA
ncbi:hypothetical protein ILUMI_12107 [Ignelater luminosus]|uniref:Uncharacterized protein n=1 Tax=Ignelater luminosus TaxID=2038154 RepID=A0A8K0CYU3_IGNLU|nr:hypothetical protein ILUMI_12107 [Ignelater luminosus]